MPTHTQHSRRKVLTIVGTRPEIIRLSCTIKKLDACFDHVLVHTGQNYDSNLRQIFFADLGLKTPKYDLNFGLNASAVSFIGAALVGIDNVLDVERPDAVLILGDTNSCLTILAAKRRKIPIFHVEAGNRCFDQRVPEEINRKIIDHLADINMTYSDNSREYLLREGFPPERVIKIGSPMFEVINAHCEEIHTSKIVENLGIGKFYLASFHREENVDDPRRLEILLRALNAVVDKFDVDVLVSTHPRTKKRIDEFGLRQEVRERINFMDPVSFTDYCHLQTAAEVVMSDSGTIFEEASILNFDAIVLRDTHERPEADEMMPCIVTGINADQILSALDVFNKHVFPRPNAIMSYGEDSVSTKIVKIIMSYIDNVNRVVWRKDA